MELNFFFANFQILGPLGCQGWVVIPQNVKKSKNHCTLVSIHKFITKPCNEVWFGHGGVWFSSRIEGALSQFFRDVGIDVRSRMRGGRGYVMMAWYDACY
jgi:hypothetical protein